MLYYTDINWLLLTASAIMSASVISLHNRGGGSTISFLNHIKIKKSNFWLVPQAKHSKFHAEESASFFETFAKFAIACNNILFEF